jgi:lipoprotein-releasing system ATP-binding protein
MLRASAIHKKYGTIEVLKGVDIEIATGEMVSIVGSSGAGKSTLLHILGTLDVADSGFVWLKDQPLHKLTTKELAHFRNRHIGFVFQFHHLLPEFTALENVCIPAWLAGEKTASTKTRAMDLLKNLGLDHRADNKPSMLSGGEQQRVAIARALINQPDIVFADEPTGNLDSANAKELHQLFRTLQQKYNQTFLIVTHNDELATLSHRTLHMKDGVILT